MNIKSIERYKHLGLIKFTVVYDVDFIDHKQERIVTITSGVSTRGEVINAIIREEYPEDRMEAVINNYLLDETNESAIEEFDIMQAFRSKAKILADEILERINNNEV